MHKKEKPKIEFIARFKNLTNIEENVKLKTRPNPNTAWPFSEAFPKDSEQGG